jgi:hypothetical protein
LATNGFANLETPHDGANRVHPFFSKHSFAVIMMSGLINNVFGTGRVLEQAQQIPGCVARQKRQEVRVLGKGARQRRLGPVAGPLQRPGDR